MKLFKEGRGSPATLSISDLPCGRIMWEKENMSLEVNSSYNVAGTKVWLYKRGKTDKELAPGGQRFCVNKEGTISPQNKSSLNLGYD